jgi:Transcriptional regulators
MPVVAGKRSSLSDVAQAAGVDVSTVSLVLNRKPLARRLRAETRERIEACARELDYRPSRAARALKTGKTGMIGIVVGDIASIFYAEVTAAALRTANLHGSQLLVAATDWSIDKERLALKSLLDAGVDGIIFLPGSFLCHTDQVATIRREKIPVVTYDYKVPGASAVFCDYTPGMERAVELLAARHRTITCLLNRNDHSAKAEPLLAACRKYGCKSNVILHGGNDFPDFENEIDIEALTAPGMPTACIISGGEVAVQVRNRLLDRGIDVPNEMEVVGLSGNRLSNFTCPSLATVRIDAQGLMEAAFRLLESGEEEIRVPTGFIPGRSILAGGQ